MRFFLKVLVVLLVAGGVFLHFLADLRGYWNKRPDRAKMVGIAAGVLVLLSIISGFFIMGTPGQVRLARFDSQKVSDLQNVQWQIVNYWQQKETLPQDISDIEDPLGGWTLPVDPQGPPFAYQYKKTGAMSFQLCATFNLASDEKSSEAMPVRPYGTVDGTWKHEAGEVCFDRSIDPERYPPYPKQKGL